MNVLIALVALVAFVVLGALYFASAPPAQIVRAVRYAGPAALALVGLVLSLAGRFVVGGPLIMMAVAWYGRQRGQGSLSGMTGQKSTVRSAWLEMELDHDTGDMDGAILAGQFEGRWLCDLNDEDLRTLAADLEDDRESAELLEAYLDRRMPGWRDDADTDSGPRHPRTHDTGAMTHEEAYQILGLEPGASAVEVRKAHRRLMQRVHPDLGGNAFLAQRVNEARDFLLRDHPD